MSLLSPSQYYRLRSVVVSLARRSTLVQASWLFQTLGALPFLDETAVAIFCSNLQACRGHFEAIHHLPYSSPLGRSLYHLRTSILHSQQLQVGRLWRSQKEVALERFLAGLHSRLDFWTISDRWQPHVASCLLGKFLSIGITFLEFCMTRSLPSVSYMEPYQRLFGSHNKRSQSLLLYQESVSTLLRLSAIVDSSIFLSRSHIVYLKWKCSTSCGKWYHLW